MSITVSAGQPIRATHINQFTRWLTGVTKDVSSSLTTTHATEYTLTVTNEETSAGNALKIVSGASTVAIFNKTGVTFTVPTTFVTGVTFSGSVGAGDGTETAPGLTFSSDTNNGLRRIGADEWALVAGGVDAIRILGLAADAPFGPRLGFGNVDEPGATDNPENLLSVHWSGSTANNGIVGIVSSINNDASAVRSAPSVVPDASAISAIISTVSTAATGAGRALEAHAIRAHSATTGDSWMGMELGIHVGGPGNSGFGTGSAFPKTMGIWVGSYQDSVMSALGVSPTAADVGLYLSSGSGTNAAGFRYPILYHDTGPTIRFYVSQAGNLAVGTNNNAAAVAYGYVADTGTGMFYGGSGVVGFAGTGTESARFTSNRNLLIGTTSDTAGTRLKVAGGLSEFQGVVNSGAFIQSLLIPATIGTSTPDYGPTGIATATVIQISSTAAVNLGGFTASQVTGQTLTVINGGGSNIVLQHENTGAVAANRFNTHSSTDYTLAPARAITALYNGSRWRTLAP